MIITMELESVHSERILSQNVGRCGMVTFQLYYDFLECKLGPIVISTLPGSIMIWDRRMLYGSEADPLESIPKGLVEILKITSSCTYSSLSSFVYNRAYTNNEGERMRNVIEYTLKHYKKPIDLDTISEVANMTKNAFCKYFKKRTNKTYIQFLNDIRIEQASKLLLANNDLSIAEIAELSGFNNISNFNRQFKSIKKMNPSQIKKLQN